MNLLHKWPPCAHLCKRSNIKIKRGGANTPVFKNFAYAIITCLTIGQSYLTQIWWLVLSKGYIWWCVKNHFALYMAKIAYCGPQMGHKNLGAIASSLSPISVVGIAWRWRFCSRIWSRFPSRPSPPKLMTTICPLLIKRANVLIPGISRVFTAIPPIYSRYLTQIQKISA